MLVGQGVKFELWDETRWNERRDQWLASDEPAGELPTDLETLSL
jgi:MraZ protein